MDDNRSWYVAKTKPRQECQVACVLEQRGVEVFNPKVILRASMFRKGASSRLEPLFPGYVFAHLDVTTEDWLLARSAPGVAYFLGAEDVPSAVPDPVVAELRRRAELQRRHGWSGFRRGDKVVISSGPMAGLDAIFDGTLSSAGRSRVLVQVLSRLVPMVVSDSALRRVS